MTHPTYIKSHSSARSGGVVCTSVAPICISTPSVPPRHHQHCLAAHAVRFVPEEPLSAASHSGTMLGAGQGRPQGGAQGGGGGGGGGGSGVVEGGHGGQASFKTMLVTTCL